ncbi:hypothetical protein Bbelb_044080 [Branchiostoma belcheri]|nr:hypothetical protein Bbelb_044080 [Branchiostoma belcheri]
MWSWALERGLTLSATHVPGLTNTLADKCSGVFSGQVWKSQTWYPEVLNMLFESPVLLPQSWDLLFLPHNRRPHPLLPDLMLAAGPRSGDSCRVGAFSAGASDLILSAWRESTSRQYQSAWAQWASWCDRREIDPVCGSIESVVEYLEWMFRQNYGYTLYVNWGGSFCDLVSDHTGQLGSATLARWVKSGVDTATFSAHFTRGASTSAATAAGVSLHSIMNAADWSRESTFLKYYRRDNNQHTFGQAVLSTALKSA